MEVTVQIPDDLVAAICNGSTDPISLRLLELAAIQAHEANLITEYEVMEMLGFQCREELYAFFKRYDVRSNYTAKDLKDDQAILAKLLDRQ